MCVCVPVCVRVRVCSEDGLALLQALTGTRLSMTARRQRRPSGSARSDVIDARDQFRLEADVRPNLLREEIMNGSGQTDTVSRHVVAKWLHVALHGIERRRLFHDWQELVYGRVPAGGGGTYGLGGRGSLSWETTLFN